VARRASEAIAGGSEHGAEAGADCLRHQRLGPFCEQGRQYHRYLEGYGCGASGLADCVGTTVYVQKVRRRHIGKVGNMRLKYDLQSGRYLDVIESYVERGINA
jgi:hypothetical protein